MKRILIGAIVVSFALAGAGCGGAVITSGPMARSGKSNHEGKSGKSNGHHKHGKSGKSNGDHKSGKSNGD